MFEVLYLWFDYIVLGAFGGVGTPVPISNTEVKHSSADGSRKARVRRCRVQCNQIETFFLFKITDAKVSVFLRLKCWFCGKRQ